MDVLFDGIPIDCSGIEDSQAKAVCSIFSSGEMNAGRKKNNQQHFTLLQSVCSVNPWINMKKNFEFFIFFRN